MVVQIVEIPVDTPAPKVFSYDEEWLAVLRETHDMLALSRRPTRFPTPFHSAPEVTREHRDVVSQSLAEKGGAQIPADGFVQTVDPHKRGQGEPPRSIPRNPQTMHVLKLLGREWNLGGGGNDQEDGAQGRVTIEDLFEAAGDVAAMHEEDDAVDDDGMFKNVELHNMDPHAISDAKAEGGSDPAAAGLMPEAVKGRAIDSGPNTAPVVGKQEQGVGNPEELDIGDDWDDGG